MLNETVCRPHGGSWEPALFVTKITEDRTRRRDGKVCGPFGIHRDQNDFGPSPWRVTHLPTGRGLLEAGDPEELRAAVDRLCTEEPGAKAWLFGPDDLPLPEDRESELVNALDRAMDGAATVKRYRRDGRDG